MLSDLRMQSYAREGKDGRSLKQACVSKRLNGADAALSHNSPYKAEVDYDMTKSPPAPIMSKEPPTKVHDWLPGWIRKHWDDDPEHPPFEPGEGMVRRPDVVIVKDPRKPPTQDNIKQVVEIKFPPDSWTREQEVDYEVIAGKGNWPPWAQTSAIATKNGLTVPKYLLKSWGSRPASQRCST